MANAAGGLIGTGMTPGGAVGAELAAITRRAFIPNLIVQIYKSTPTLNMLMRGRQRAKGGVGQITVPVQGQSYVSSEWIGYGGSFTQPADTTATQDAAQNLTVLATPISFQGLESLIQSSEVVIPRLKAKMADIYNVSVQALSQALWGYNTNPLIMSGFLQAYDDGTGASSIYANIDRSVTSNAFWKGQETVNFGANPTRANMLTALMQTATGAGGEAPDVIIMSPPDWTTLMQDFVSIERIDMMPGSKYGKNEPINTGYSALQLLNTNIVADLYCPVGTAIMLNTKYFAMYLSDDANFAFSGFQSAIANLQVASIGLMIVALQTVCVKPVSGRKILGITGAAF